MRQQGVRVVAGLALTQVIGWGTTFYLPAVLGQGIVQQIQIPVTLAFGGISIMMLMGALLSPPVARCIQRHGVRRVMTIGSALTGAGLLLLSQAQGLWSYVAAWALLGVAMPMTLNLAAYVALAHTFTTNATRAMTVLGFFTGITSTIAWPVTGALAGPLGWRGVCMAYAALHLLVALPLHWHILRHARSPAEEAVPMGLQSDAKAPAHTDSASLFPVLAVTLGLNCFLMTGLQAHLLGILQGLGVATALSIALGTLMGPSQVCSRAVSFVWAQHTPAIRLALAATSLFCVGLLVFASSDGWVWSLGAAIVVMGTAMGLSLPMRATLPYEIYGKARFGHYMGKLGLVQNLASAAAPMAMASTLATLGAVTTLLLAEVLAVASLVAMVVLSHRLSKASERPAC
jgi:MFS family permease